MVEVRDTERDLYQLRLRLAIAMGLVLACFGILVGRFVYLQIYRYADFHAQAEDNRIALVPAPPARGLIFDRNGVLLAENVSSYTLEISPKRVSRLDHHAHERRRAGLDRAHRSHGQAGREQPVEAGSDQHVALAHVGVGAQVAQLDRAVGRSAESDRALAGAADLDRDRRPAIGDQRDLARQGIDAGHLADDPG